LSGQRTWPSPPLSSSLSSTCTSRGGGYNLAHFYAVPAVLLLCYVLSGTRWCAFVGLVWSFHIAGDRVLGYGLKFVSGFNDTHLGTIGRQRG
jgi:hypothetical protein